MRILRILIPILTLILLCSCSGHKAADRAVDRSPVAFSVSKQGLINAPQDPKEQEYSHLNQPLHLIPRELLQTATDNWIEYIQPEGIGVYYLYSYDAGKSINTYVVYLDIIAQTTLPFHGFTTELGEEYTFYNAQQRIRISPGFVGAVKWDKATDTLSVWENPPYNPTVEINSIQVEKESEEIGTVLTEWLYGGTITDPQYNANKLIPGINIIAKIVRRLTLDNPYDALNLVTYALIENPQENGSITKWKKSEELHFTSPKEEHRNSIVSFQNNYIAQSNFYGNLALGGICVYPNGKLADTAHNIVLQCTFSTTDMPYDGQMNWRIDLSLSLEK